MMNTIKRLGMMGVILGATACALPAMAAGAKPIKVYILAGQSNMQGHAAVTTFPHIGMDPKTAPMLRDMTDDKGDPITVPNVWIAEIGSGPNPSEPRTGPLNATYGVTRSVANIGPEYTFGIYMHKHDPDQPILLIKTAWGGKSLNTDFRPPSAGVYDNWINPESVDDQKKKERADASGVYYRKMIEFVKSVLADPGQACPAYNKEAGYEIAGFVWFQGWNDMVDSGTYPNRNKIDGYALYTKLMVAFIKDVRKELDVPKMPFVIGVIGVGGIPTPETEAAAAPRYRGIKPAIQKAMSDPANLPEFKGNVAAVLTGQYWDAELDAAIEKYNQKVNGSFKELTKDKKLSREEQDALRKKLEQENMTPRELQILVGKSNQGFHYNGSAKILGGIGKGFAEAMIHLEETGPKP
ncbi:MAG: hypothetical protein GC164_02290 [Phycisphaera sp.]|nr:hypothetical protein [Phycisphaera sp.]